MACNKWGFQTRKTAARTGFPFSFSHRPQGNFRAGSNNFCTSAALGTSDNFFKIKNNRWNNSSSPLLLWLPQRQQQQQRCAYNCSSSDGAAAAAYNKVLSPASSFSSSASSSKPPFLMLPSEGVEADGDTVEVNYRAFFSLRDKKVMKLQKELPQQIFDARCRRSSRGWLAYMSRQDCGIYLADLFSTSSSISPPKVVPLPSILTLPECKANAEKIESNPCHMSMFLVTHLAMSSSPTLDDDTVDLNKDCVVMMQADDGHLLAFCRIGDPTWTPLPGSIAPCEDNVETEGLEDVIYSRKDKMFYSFRSDAQVQAWDFNNAGDDGFPERIDFDIDFHPMFYPDFYFEKFDDKVYSTENYLVESPEGEFLCLKKCCVSIDKDRSPKSYACRPYRTVFFSAYKLDFEKKIGIPIKSLGDAALFLGLNESFSLSTRDHPELMPNSIYFTDDLLTGEIFHFAGGDMGVYNFEDYSVTPLCHLYHPSPFKKLQPNPIWVSRT